MQRQRFHQAAGQIRRLVPQFRHRDRFPEVPLAGAADRVEPRHPLAVCVDQAPIGGAGEPEGEGIAAQQMLLPQPTQQRLVRALVVERDAGAADHPLDPQDFVGVGVPPPQPQPQPPLHLLHIQQPTGQDLQLAAADPVLEQVVQVGGDAMPVHVPDHGGVAQEAAPFDVRQLPPELLGDRPQGIDHPAPVVSIPDRQLGPLPDQPPQPQHRAGGVRRAQKGRDRSVSPVGIGGVAPAREGDHGPPVPLALQRHHHVDHRQAGA